MASVLVHLVKRDQHATAMLDHSATDAGSVKSTVKERLDRYLMTPGDITEDLVKEVCMERNVLLCYLQLLCYLGTGGEGGRGGGGGGGGRGEGGGEECSFWKE